MLQALNTGHDGSLSTIHANGAADALARLETLVLLAELADCRSPRCGRRWPSSIDAVVFVARGAGGVRRVEAIAEVRRRRDRTRGRRPAACSRRATRGALVPVDRADPPAAPARRRRERGPSGSR